MNMLKMCFNWKVLTGLGAVGLAIWVVAPGAALAALPLLLILVCPLSMVLMMGMMGRGTGEHLAAGAPGEYICPMHPQVQASTPGRCPACGMNLVPTSPQGGPSDRQGAGTRERQLSELRTELQQLNERQAELARHVTELEQEQKSGGPPLAEAERIAAAADRSPH